VSIEECIMRIKDVMTHPAVTCPAEASMDQPARLMWEFDCGIVPLVGADGRLAGVITDRDICMAALTQGRPLHDIAVASAMSTTLVTCGPGDSIEGVESVMRESRVRRVPVVDADGYLVGVVSLNDLARLVGRAHKSPLDRTLVQTLAAVGEPRGRTLPVSAQSAPPDVLV